MKTANYFKALIFIIAASNIFLSCSKGGGGSTAPKATNTVSTFAGAGSSGSANGTGTSASFSYPSAIISANGEFFIGDFGNSLIRTINISSALTATLAGNGTSGLLNGTLTNAEFNGPANIAFDAIGNLFVSDEQNHSIREITTTGNVLTVAGTGSAGYQDGVGTAAAFDHPEGIVVDANGNIFVADGHNNVVRKIVIATGAVSTYAGTGTPAFDNGPIASATFNDPYGMAIDASGNLYVTDVRNNCIRKITVSTGSVSTYAGSGAQGLTNGSSATATFYYPLGCTFDSGGNMFVSDTYNNVIREVKANGTVITFAGTGKSGLANGPATTATFNFPIGILVYGNGIYVADTHNNVIRKITVGQ